MSEVSKNGVAVYPQGQHPRDVRKEQEAQEPRKEEPKSGVADTGAQSSPEEKPAKTKSSKK